MCAGVRERERVFFIENLLVRIHLIIVVIRWTGLAPWEFEFPFSGSLTSSVSLLGNNDWVDQVLPGRSPLRSPRRMQDLSPSSASKAALRTTMRP